LNVKSDFIAEETVSKSGKSKPASMSEAVELRQLAVLELRRRQLRRELASLECQFQQLQLEIELKGIQAPWLKNDNT
jgi:hypothetical protein